MDGRGISLRRMLVISAWFGLIAGFGEGLADLTVAHFHALSILSVTLVADLAMFLTLGLILWPISRALGRIAGGRLASPGPRGASLRLDLALPFFVFTWVLLYGWAKGPFQGPSLTALVVNTVAALLVAVGARGRFEGVARILRGSLPWLAGAAVLCGLAIPIYGFWAERQAMQALSAIAPDAPNVVLVILDTVRADHLGSYGYGRATSPNLDRLGQQGVLFETAIAPSSWTLPSHASMMTGTYPHTHQVTTPEKELAAGFPTLPWALRQAGYRTAAFSGNTFFFSRRNGLGQGFIHFGDFFLSASDALAQVHYAQGLDGLQDGVLLEWGLVKDFLGRQDAAEINRAALRWLDRSRRPFFLVLNYMDAHDPYVPPQPWRHRFSTEPEPVGRLSFPRMTPGQVQEATDAYDGAIAYEDHQVGQLLDELARRALLSHTLVVVTSDHGEAFGAHGLVMHGNALYFPLVHVPLLFHWPGHVPAGVRVARPVSTKDLPATVLELLGLPQGNLPGESLATLWSGRANLSHWPLPLSELSQMKLERQFPNYYGSLETIVAPEAQYIVDPRVGPLLYDWKVDPREVHNLIHDPRYQTLAAELGDELKAEQQPQAPGGVAAEGLPVSRR